MTSPTYDHIRSPTDGQPPAAGDPRDDVEESAAWGAAVRHESPIYPSLAVVGSLVLFLVLYVDGLKGVVPFGPLIVIVPTLEVLLLAPLMVARSRDVYRGHSLTRSLSISLIAVINLANLLSLVQLIHLLITPHAIHPGQTPQLLFSSVDVWLTNVIVFALWYWELDRGGPYTRRLVRHRQPDFLFPQMTTPYCAPKGWAPDFVDYFYVAFTNATAFSPTDTLPLTRWAKVLMMVQSFASLITVALVAARAVNILQ
jgi:hypothetical protein